MTSSRHGEVTALLDAIRAGDGAARNRLYTLVYQELHSLAVGLMNRERRNHTLGPTALINEAFLRLNAQEAQTKAPNRNFPTVRTRS
jgi:hypothetical protein